MTPSDCGREQIRPQLRPSRLALSLLVSAVSFFLAAGILPGFDVGDFWRALLGALVVAALNAVLPPLVAALRLPYTVATTFLLVLVVDAAILLVASRSWTTWRWGASAPRSSPRSS